MDINQENVDKVFNIKFGNGCNYHNYNECQIIKKIIKDVFKIEISSLEAKEFWEWRSHKYDAAFLLLPDNDIVLTSDISKWFIEFCETYFKHF